MKRKIHRIVLTGGPCGGKTTVLVALAERLEEAGFTVIIGFEGATALIQNRVSPQKLGTSLFQRSLFDFEISKAAWLERSAEEIAAETGRPVVIIYDRTWLDAKAYTAEEDWNRLLARFNPTAVSDPNGWGVIHLVTAADGAAAFYTLENNSARFETPEEACRRDRLLADSYQHVEHRFIIGNDGNFARKVHRAIEAACRFVGIPEPLEIERWFEVESFDAAALAEHRPVRVEIFQFYLPDGSRYRRRKLPDGSLTFSRTWKREVGDDSSVRAEVSAMLSPFEFGEAWEGNRDAPRVHKVRSVFDFGQYRLELDEFRKPTGLIKLEIETPTVGETPTLPDWIKVKREVTGNPHFSNEALARLP